jgi:protein-S-isoprenylcysteine O-methyltransferase Ste14
LKNLSLFRFALAAEAHFLYAEGVARGLIKGSIMPILHWLFFCSLLLTWGVYGVKVMRYFKHSQDRTALKSALIIFGWFCTVAQLVLIAMTGVPFVVWTILGFAFLVTGNVLFWSALKAHGKQHPAFAFIPVPPSQLTTAGPYSIVRHPIYTAYLLIWLAGAIGAAQPLLLIAPLVMGIFYLIAAYQEEQAFLGSNLAAAYREYQSRTGMFVPKLLRMAR